MGISRRAFARTRGISEAAVRAHIKSGTLADAILPDGTIDASKADKLLAAANTRPKPGRTPAVLASARQRRVRAQARDLQDEVYDLERHLIPPGVAEQMLNQALDGPAAIARRWPPRVAPTVASRPADVVQRLLKEGVNDLLGEMHDSFPEAPEEEPAPEQDITETMTPVELAAHIEHLRARILELGRAERQRLLVRVEDTMEVFEEALSIAKSLLKAIPGRLDVLIATTDATEAERLLANEIEAFIAAAHIDLGPLTEGVSS